MALQGIVITSQPPHLLTLIPSDLSHSDQMHITQETEDYSNRWLMKALITTKIVKDEVMFTRLKTWRWRAISMTMIMKNRLEATKDIAMLTNKGLTHLKAWPSSTTISIGILHPNTPTIMKLLIDQDTAQSRNINTSIYVKNRTTRALREKLNMKLLTLLNSKELSIMKIVEKTPLQE